MRRDFLVVLAAVLLTLVVLSPVAYTAYQAMPPRVAVVDLQKLIEEDQKPTLDALAASSGTASDSQRLLIQNRTQDFAQRLSRAVEQLGAECRCVLVNQAALLGGQSLDYTDWVRTRVRSLGK